ncbi:MAG TPA: hypothetical protein VD861_19095 [Pyrinomonadaceae bacterium]|nr:hypothetical protein [Pyrinomonadaceae bacterium]
MSDNTLWWFGLSDEEIAEELAEERRQDSRPTPPGGVGVTDDF